MKLLRFSLLVAAGASLSKPVAPFDPYEVAAYIEEQAASAPLAEDGQPRILVIGDSWADVVGFGWALKLVVKRYDYIFFTLVGNDALDKMPSCASADPTKSSAQCGDDLMADVLPNMYKMVDGIHKGNPDARVVSFGYDTMFGGLGCGSVTKDMFPQCYNGQDVPKEQGNRCFNTQFLRIQEAIDWVDGNRTFFDSASILGATQVAAGDTKASTDPNERHIDMDEMGPAKYWPVYEACFHPGVFGGDDSGAMIVMEEFYKVYWSKQLSCDSESIAV